MLVKNNPTLTSSCEFAFLQTCANKAAVPCDAAVLCGVSELAADIAEAPAPRRIGFDSSRSLWPERAAAVKPPVAFPPEALAAAVDAARAPALYLVPFGLEPPEPPATFFDFPLSPFLPIADNYHAGFASDNFIKNSEILMLDLPPSSGKSEFVLFSNSFSHCLPTQVGGDRQKTEKKKRKTATAGYK